MANKSISQLTSAAAVAETDLLATAIVDGGSATGYATRKHTIANVGAHILKQRAYSTAEHVVGTWINGKPLYEKAVAYTWADMHETSVATGHVSCNIYTDFGDDVDFLEIDFGNSSLFFGLSQSIVSCPFCYVASGSYIRINLQRQSHINNNKVFAYFDATYPSAISTMYSSANWYVVYRYTKTADVL